MADISVLSEDRIVVHLLFTFRNHNFPSNNDVTSSLLCDQPAKVLVNIS